MALERSIPALLEIASRRATLRLLALSLLGATTEGLGFVLLVPLIALAAGGSEQFALPFDLPPLSLPVLLAIFVILVILRSGIEIARRIAAQSLRARVVDGLRMRAVDALLDANWRWAMTQRRGGAVLFTFCALYNIFFLSEACVGQCACVRVPLRKNK